MLVYILLQNTVVLGLAVREKIKKKNDEGMGNKIGVGNNEERGKWVKVKGENCIKTE